MRLTGAYVPSPLHVALNLTDWVNRKFASGAVLLASTLTLRVYGDLDEKLMAAAEMTMRAHLKKLVDDGAVRYKGEGDQEVFDAPVS